MIFVFSMVGNVVMLVVFFYRGFCFFLCKDILLFNMIVVEFVVVIISILFDFILLFLNDGWLFGFFMCYILWLM